MEKIKAGKHFPAATNAANNMDVQKNQYIIYSPHRDMDISRSRSHNLWIYQVTHLFAGCNVTPEAKFEMPWQSTTHHILVQR